MLKLSVSQNKYLPSGGREVDALVTVTAAGLGPAGAAPAEVILTDCSGSMGSPPTKLIAARKATIAAIDALPDGASFAVVQGTGRATMVYPPQPDPTVAPRLAVATPQTRAAARAAVGWLSAAGGTAIGQWLLLAGRLLDGHPGGVRHALLLTDGRNEHEQPYELAAVLDRCAGRFNCDARAIGDAWEPEELQRIVARLRGVAQEVRPDRLADDFRELITTVTGRALPELRLGVRTMQGVRIRFLRQLHPTAFDLTGDAVGAGERTVEFSIGSWGDQTAEYHLGLEADPGRFDEATDNQVALVRVRPAGDAAGDPDPEGVFAHWTDDLVRATRMDPGLSHHDGQAELRAAVNAGCDAFDAGDPERVLELWGRAVALAHASGHAELLRRLDDVVVVLDPAAGRIRLRDDIDLRARKALLLSSAMSSAMSPADPHGPGLSRAAGPPGDRPDVSCPHCHRVSPGGSTFCEACCHQLGGPE